MIISYGSTSSNPDKMFRYMWLLSSFSDEKIGAQRD
jgi:hypothetical protein